MLTFAIVTPSYNQDQYISETIESVLSQKGNFKIEYIVVDGRSTDKTVEILKKYQEKIENNQIEIQCNSIDFKWLSEKDAGQYDAVNKGFQLVNGDIMAWINSDDKYTPWAFSVVNQIFSSYEKVEWLSSTMPIVWNKNGQAIRVNPYHGFNKKAFLKGFNILKEEWHSEYWISQDNTFWKRSLWEKANTSLDNNYDFAADFKLWVEFYNFAELYGVCCPLAGYRFHDIQKTLDGERYIREALEILRNNGGDTYSKLETILRKKLYPLLDKNGLSRRLLNKFKAYYDAKNFVSYNREGRWDLIHERFL